MRRQPVPIRLATAIAEYVDQDAAITAQRGHIVHLVNTQTCEALKRT